MEERLYPAPNDLRCNDGKRDRNTPQPHPNPHQKNQTVKTKVGSQWRGTTTRETIRNRYLVKGGTKEKGRIKRGVRK